MYSVKIFVFFSSYVIQKKNAFISYKEKHNNIVQYIKMNTNNIFPK